MRVDRQLEQQVKQLYPGVLTNLQPEQKQKVIQAIQAASAQGPLVAGSQHVSVKHTHTNFQTSPVPPPDFLEGYNQHIPNGGDRLFTVVENQSAHRIEMEKETIKTQNKATLRGQWIALGLVILFSSIAERAMELGYPNVAVTIFATTIIGVVSVFITGKVTMKRNLDAKQPDREK